MTLNISDLTNADRVEIFKHLAVDELEGIRVNILDSIASTHFHSFLDFCDKVFSERESIQDVSCSMDNDGLHFDIIYK